MSSTIPSCDSMDADTFPCRPLVHNRDEPEEGTLTIDDHQVAQIRILLDQTDSLESWPINFCGILSPKLYSSAIFTITDAFRKLIVKYPCHVCHKPILKALLTVINMKFRKELPPSFLRQVLRNTYLNRQRMSTEIAALSCEVFIEYIPDDPFGLGLIYGDYNLVEIFEALIAQFGPDWKVISRDNLKVYQILSCVLSTYKTITFVHYDDRLINYCPDERVQMGLAKAFEFSPYLVTRIASNIMQSIDVVKTDVDDAWKFYDSFTLMLFEANAWKKRPTCAVRYLETIDILNRTLFNTHPQILSETIIIRSRYSQNIKSLLAVASVLGVFETLNLYDIIIKGVLDVVYELNLVDDLFELFYRKIRMILREGPVELDHSAKLGEPELRLSIKFKYKCKSARDFVPARDDDDDSSKWIQKIFKTIKKLIQKQAVVRFDLEFLQALITVGGSEQMYNSGSYLVDLLRYILERKIASKFDVLNTGIVQEIFNVINGFHNNCVLCAHGLDSSVALLDLLVPTEEEGFNWAKNSTAKMATTIPYVVRDKERLIEIMYPTGFKMLTEQLQRDENIESLYLVSQTLIKKPSEMRALENAKGWELPVDGSRFYTKTFVLDDGTKIIADITRLIEYSKYFASLFDGRFHEAKLNEIRIHDVTAFQFDFLLHYIQWESTEQKIVFDHIDLDQHLDLIILFDKLVLRHLCCHMVHSLRWTRLTPDVLPDVYNVGFMYGIESLRLACVNFALSNDGDTDELAVTGVLKITGEWKTKMLKSLFQQTSDRKLLAEDVDKCIMLKCNRAFESS